MKSLTRWVRRSMFTFLHKSFNLLVIFAFMLQPFGATGFNVRVLASEGDATVVEPTVVAPVETPAPKVEAVTPVEEKIVTPPKVEVVPAETPVVTPKTETVAPIETPVVAPKAEEVAPVVTPTETAVTSPETPVDTATVITPAPAETPVVNAETTVTPAPVEVPVVAPVIPVETWGAQIGNKATTNSSVELGKVYVAPQNDQVTVTFTKLPEKVGTLSIEEITLTPEQVKTLGALSNKAYDITSDMVDGTFAYDLTLPKSADQKNVEIKFAETKAGLENAETVATGDVKTETNSVSAALNHFTIFVVTGLTASPNCAGASVTPPNGTTACYLTIQEAINIAATNDTINIAAGDYTGNLIIDKSLTLIGAGDGTHIFGNINSTGANVTIQNLKITNSYSDDHGVSNFGVKATAGKALTLENVTIDVLYYGVHMLGGSSANGTAITINNSRIKGYAAIYLNGAGATNAVVTIDNTSLKGTTSYSGSSDDFAVIAIRNASGVHMNFTGTSSVVNEFTGGAQAKEHLIFFNNADAVVVTGIPTYTNAANSTVSTGARFASAYGPYTNTVEGQVVARYVQNTAEFESALASDVTTPIVVGRYETAINTTDGTKTLNAETTLIIEDGTPTTITAGTTLVNKGIIIIESGATFTNNGMINGSGTISGTVSGSGKTYNTTLNVYQTTLGSLSGSPQGNVYLAGSDAPFLAARNTAIAGTLPNRTTTPLSNLLYGVLVVFSVANCICSQ